MIEKIEAFESELGKVENEPDLEEREWQATLHNLHACGFYIPTTWFKILPTNSSPDE